MDVHLRELRYFAAVAEELHFTQAAARLFVSQPALSKQIRALERRLGFALFDRHARGVALTGQGQALLPVAQALLDQWDRGYAEARAHGQPSVLVVGMQTAVGRDLQRPALQRFRRDVPDWTVSLRLVSWDDPTAGLADASSDVAFVWLPIPMSGLSIRVLASERRWVALSDDHPLAARDTLVLGDLLDEPFVALPPAAGALRDFWLATDARGGTAPTIGAEASRPDEVFEAVGSGLGVVLLAEGNVKLYRRPGITARLVTDLPPAELAVAWRTADRRPAVAAFLASVH